MAPGDSDAGIRPKSSVIYFESGNSFAGIGPCKKLIEVCLLASEDLESLVAEGQTYEETSKEELINLLKDAGIIYIPPKEKIENETIGIEKEYELVIRTGKKESLKSMTEDEIEKFTKSIRKTANLKEEDDFHFSCKVEFIGFKLSPRVKFFEVDYKNISIEDLFNNNNVFYKNGFFMSSDKKFWDAEDFNKLISIFNILNVPFDFVHDYELVHFGDAIFTNGIHLENLELFGSKKAYLRGIGYKALQMKVNDFLNLISTVNCVWKCVEESKIVNTGNIFIFLGYGRYYHFHGDYLLAFSNTWMFIEAIINLMWEKMMLDSGFSKNYLKSIERNWSLQEIIDVLLLKGLINKKTNVEAQKLRSIRNKVFHVSKDVSKRKIDDKLSEECIDLGLYLFYQNIDFLDPDHIVSFDTIKSSLDECIHQTQFL